MTNLYSIASFLIFEFLHDRCGGFPDGQPTVEKSHLIEHPKGKRSVRRTHIVQVGKRNPNKTVALTATA